MEEPLRIRLERGISRDPSDRMNSDGGIAESLNAFVLGNETAPAMPPKDIKNKFNLPDHNRPELNRYDSTFRAVYIHRTVNEDHFIYVSRSKVYDREGNEHFAEALYAYPGANLITSFPWDVGVLDDTVTSTGNILVFSTTAGNGYAVYRKNGETGTGEYIYYGSSIPALKIDCTPVLYGKSDLTTGARKRFSVIEPVEVGKGKPRRTGRAEEWNENYEGTESVDRDNLYRDSMNKIWSAIKSSRVLVSSYFRVPVFVRFAIRMIDGSYMRHTVPYFMSNGNVRNLKYTLHCQWDYDGSLGEDHDWEKTIEISGKGDEFRIKVKLNNASELRNWRDVIESVDMFISEPVMYPEYDSEFLRAIAIDSSNPFDIRNGSNKMEMIVGEEPESEDDKQAMIDELLDKSRIFYKVRSFPIDNLDELENGIEIKNSEELSLTEKLYTKANLPDDYRSNHDYIPKSSQAINGRILSQGMKEIFSQGLFSAPAVAYHDWVSDMVIIPGKKYSVRFGIQDSTGSMVYVDSEDLDMPKIHIRTMGMEDFEPSAVNSDMMQVLFYPDTRCTKAYITSDGVTSEVKMKPHPYLSCAYWIGDLTKTLKDMETSEMELPAGAAYGYSYSDSYLFQSELYNPFLYPVGGRIRLQAKIIALASVTTPLSQGQFGQYALYAFTDQGIWALSPNDEGKYISIDPNPVSRDVCISARSVTPIDQAIVFITSRGVMLLNGSSVVCLSLNMNGKHYAMEESVVSAMRSMGIGYDYGNALTDKTPFMGYMTDTRAGETQVAYDYAGSRLIFFNPHYNYEYIYMLGTQTWHKYVMDIQKNDSQIMDIKILNSYPDCYMFCGDEEDNLYLFNWSTVLSELDEETEVTSIISTRPFDLGKIDMYKSIRHLKIGGSYERYGTDKNGRLFKRVEYKILGSQDGVHFHLLDSLGGKSWKMFRIVLIARLRSTERVSDIAFEGTARFTNKIR